MKKVFLTVTYERCAGTDFHPSIRIGVFSTQKKAERAELLERSNRVDGILTNTRVLEAEVE